MAFGSSPSGGADAAGTASRAGEAVVALWHGCLREEEGVDGPLPGLAMGSGKGQGDGARCGDVYHLRRVLVEELCGWPVLLNHGRHPGARGGHHQPGIGGELGREAGSRPSGAQAKEVAGQAGGFDDARRGGDCRRCWRLFGNR